MGRGLSPESRRLIERAFEVLAVEHPSGIRRVAYALFGNRAGLEVKRLGKLLTRARKSGVIPWAWITDSTRTEVEPFVVEDVAGVRGINRTCPAFDPWREQPTRVKVWSEKSIGGTLEPVLLQYLVGFLVLHGNTSTTSIRDLAESTWKDPRHLVVLYVGDHDPKGLRISEHDLPKRFCELEVENFTIRRVALTSLDAVRLREQRDRFKPNDSDVAWYRNETGLNYGVELEAIPSTELSDRVAAAIHAEIADVRAWNSTMEASRIVRESWQDYVDQWPAPSIRPLRPE